MDGQLKATQLNFDKTLNWINKNRNAKFCCSIDVLCQLSVRKLFSIIYNFVKQIHKIEFLCPSLWLSTRPSVITRPPNLFQAWLGSAEWQWIQKLPPAAFCKMVQSVIISISQWSFGSAVLLTRGVVAICFGGWRIKRTSAPTQELASVLQTHFPLSVYSAYDIKLLK